MRPENNWRGLKTSLTAMSDVPVSDYRPYLWSWVYVFELKTNIVPFCSDEWPLSALLTAAVIVRR